MSTNWKYNKTIVGIPQHKQPAMPSKDPAVADKAAIPQLLTRQYRQLPAPKPSDVIRIKPAVDQTEQTNENS